MSFDQLKREAVNLERQLEDKVSRYQQVIRSKLKSIHLVVPFPLAHFSLQQLAQKINKAAVSNDLAMTESGGVPWDEEATLQQDIQRSLTQLQELITGRLPPSANSPSQKAVVSRYRDILLDLRSDFEKSRLAVRRATERKELLSGGGMVGGNGQDPAMDHLLRERNHINNSMNAASNVIGQADAIRSDLRIQGRSLRNAGNLIGTITSNIPGVNHLVEQIRRRRSRDDKIVAGVIATCILFTLWYIF